MLKIESNNKSLRVVASGSIPEISTDLVKAVQQVREGIHENTSEGEAEAFDIFLKDIFIDLVLAENVEDAVDALVDKLRRNIQKNETEHKQD